MTGDEAFSRGVDEVSGSLDSQYDLRSAFPEYVTYFEDWRARGEQARVSQKCFLDQPYGTGARERIDLFPAPEPNGQLFLFIHGGYWRFMDKSDFSFIVHPYLRRNISVGLINYSLFPGTTMGEVVRQIRNACKWIVANCGSYGIAPRELHLGGWSAGAHLACMAAATLDTHNAAPEIDSVLAISGVFDLRPLLRTSANADLKLDEAEALRNSPVDLIPRRGQRIALLWGGGETEAFREQSRIFSANWRGKGADLRAEEIAKLHHYAIMDSLAREGTRVLKASLALLGCEYQG